MNSSELKGYLTGLIFGDARVDNGVTKRALEIKSVYKDFIDKIKDDLESCSQFSIDVQHKDEYTSNDGVHHKECWILRIKAHPYFNKKYHHFYDDYRHRIASKESLNWLTANGLANWYMSDGYVCLVGKTKGCVYNRRVDICTDRYSLNTVVKMQEMLLNKFNIQTTINKRGKLYRLRIKQNSYENFINIIKPYIVSSMMYKLYLGYEQQPKWMSDDMWDFQKSLSSAIALTSKVEG